jgi:basic membrane protein A
LVAIVIVALVMALGPQPTRVGLVTQGVEVSGFDQMAAAGLERAATELGIEGSHVVVLSDVAENLSTMAESGYELIALPGVIYAEGLVAAAPDHPDTAFAILDAPIELPNVISVLFAEEQGSFLVGAAAALESKTGVVGFMGGMPIPVVEGFRAGFEAGARAADPGVVVLVAWLTDDPMNFSGAFGNSGGGQVAAAALFDAGADIVFHAAGASGFGLFEEAWDRTAATGNHHWAIGADTDQYLEAPYEYRPYILTSMVKRLDSAVYEAVRKYETEGPAGGIIVLDLAADGVGYSTSGDHLAPDTIDTLEELRADVVSGAIVVPVTPDGPGRVVSLTAAQEVAIEFDGESCSYDGPPAFAAGTTVSLRATNLAAGSAFTAVLEIPPDVTLEMMREIAETWRVADGPPEGVDGGELGGLDLWPEATSESVFVVGRQQFAIQVIYPLSPDGRVFPCELLSIAEE